MDDQTKRLRGGAVEVCPECDIAGCRHIRARTALAAQPTAPDWPAINAIIARHFADDPANACRAHATIAEVLRAQHAASAQPSVHEINREMTNAGWQNSGIRQADLPKVARVVRTLLSRYGRPAGDAQPVARADVFMRDGRRQFLLCELGTTAAASLPLGKHDLYAAPVAAQKADDALDAERYRWLRNPCSGAERVIFYSRGDYGRGLMSSSMLDAAIDAAMAQQRQEEK